MASGEYIHMKVAAEDSIYSQRVAIIMMSNNDDTRVRFEKLTSRRVRRSITDMNEEMSIRRMI